MTCLLEHGADMSFDDSEGAAQDIAPYQPTIEAYELLMADSLAVRNTPTWVGIVLQAVIIPWAKNLAKGIVARATAERQAVYPMFLIKADGPNVLEAVEKIDDPQQRYMLTLLRHGLFPRFLSNGIGGAIGRAVKSALQFGISNGQVEVVEELLNLGVDINIPVKSETPLYIAVENRNVAMTRMLLSRGADVNCIPSSSPNWPGRVYHAVRHPIFAVLPSISMPAHKVESCLTLMSLLLDAGTDVNIRDGDDDGETLLAAAVNNGSAAAVRFLLSSGADPNLEDSKGRIPLQIPVYTGGATEIVRLLIPKTRDINHRDHEGATPLIELVRNNTNFEAVKLLLEAGASSGINIVSSKGTALQRATWWVTEEMIGALLDAGADPNIIGGQHESALMSVASVNTSSLPLIRLLLGHGANAAYANSTGNTALHVVVEATAEDWLESAKLLIQHGANVNAARTTHGGYHDAAGDDASSITPLVLMLRRCVRWGERGTMAEIAIFLAQNGADTSLLSDRLRQELERIMRTPI